MQDSHNKIIIYITAAYFIFLLAILFVFGYSPANDTEGYIELAQICLAEHQPYPCLKIIEEQPFIWNIGSINLIALSLWLFNTTYPILILMCVLKALTALLTAKIALTLSGNQKISLITIVIYVLYPNNWGQSTTLMSEIPAIFLAMLALHIILKKKNITLFILSGILLCLSDWFRSTAIIFIVCIFLYYIIFARKEIIRRIFPMLCGYVICALLIGTESYLRTGYFIYKGDTLWFNICDDAYDGAEVGPHYGQETFEKGKPRYIENMSELNCFECEDIWKKRCIEWIGNHKIEWLKKIPYRVMFMYFNDIDNMQFTISDKSNSEDNYITLPYKNLYQEIFNLTGPQYLALTCTFYYWIMMCLFIAGTVIQIYKRDWKSLFLPLSIVIIGTLALTLVIHGETRFKAPFMPFIMIICSSGLLYISDKTKRLLK